MITQVRSCGRAECRDLESVSDGENGSSDEAAEAAEEAAAPARKRNRTVHRD